MSIILNDRDKALQAATFRTMSTTVDIVSSNGSAFRTLKNGGTTTPTDTILTATASSIFTAAAIYTWQYSLSSSSTTWVSISAGTANTLTITSASVLANIGTAASINYRCVVTEPGLITATGSYNITYNKELSESIVIDISRTNAIISCDSTGAPIGFSNTDATISVSRGGTALSYSDTGGANTFKVSIQADDVARTVGTINTTTTTYGISGITAINVDLATVVFAITVYDAAGVVVSPIFAKQITYTKVTSGLIGADAVSYYIESTSPVISKTTASASLPGTHTQVTFTAQKISGNALPANYGFLTLTPNDVTEASTATATTITTTIGNSDGKTSYTVKMYNQATVSGATLLDTLVIPVVFSGNNTVTAVLTNEATSVPTNYLGTVGVYTATSTELHVYDGNTDLVYDGAGLTVGTWKFTYVASNITIGTITDSGNYASINNASNILSDTATIVYTITGFSFSNVPFTITKTQSFGRIVDGKDGATFSITNSMAVFNKDTAGVKSPTSITLNTTSQNITGTIAYQWQKNGTNISALNGGTAASYVVPIADYAAVTTNTYKCTITGTINSVALSTLSDQITIPLLSDGSGAISILNSNENITFSAPNSGYTGITFGSSSVVIRAFIGTTALTYDDAATPGNNTFKVTRSVSGFTVAAGTFTAGGTTYTVSAPTAASADSGYIVFTVAIKDDKGVVSSTTSTTTYSLSRIGPTAPAFTITNSGAIFNKNEAGTISPATLTLTTDIRNIISPQYQWQKNGSNISGATGVSYVVNTATDYLSGIESNIYKCTVTGTISGLASQTMSDQITVPLLVAGSSAVTINNSNENIVFSAPNTGYTGITLTSGSFIVRAYIGTKALTYDATATPANNTFKATQVTTGATVATVAPALGSLTYNVPAPTAMSTDSASTVVTVTIKNAAGVLSTIDTTTTYGLSRVGPTGVGNKSVTISAYAWGLTMPAIPTTSYVYTWATGAITYPTGWLKQPDIGTSGQTLYQINLIITGTTSDITTSGIDWAAATSNTVGYRLDGSIGPQGTSARKAYVITTRITPPPSPTSGTGDVIPSSKVTNTDGTEVPWVLVAQDVLLPNYYMYTVDGTWTATATTINGVAIPAGNIAWGTPYLSNLKVGSLSAISANLGVIDAGSLNINNKFMVANTGAVTIQSGTTGARMLTTENFIKIYDTNGALRVQLGNLSM